MRVYSLKCEASQKHIVTVDFLMLVAFKIGAVSSY